MVDNVVRQKHTHHSTSRTPSLLVVPQLDSAVADAGKRGK